MRRRVEVATTGIDEALQGLTSDPIGLALPQTTGLRIPPVLPSYTTPLAQPRYYFCLATRVIDGKTRLRGVRQYVTLGVDAHFGTPPERPIEMVVTTPTFHFTDGNISWHLVTEAVGRRPTSFLSTNASGWAFQQTDASAMLYEKFTNTAVDPVTGAPLFYFQGLTAYTPPELSGAWRDICGYGNMHHICFPWFGRQWGEIDQLIEGQVRISLYATVLQTNPTTRTSITPPSPWNLPAATPEEAFIVDWSQEGLGPIYWRIAGSLIFDDDGEDDFSPVRVKTDSMMVGAPPGTPAPGEVP